VHKVTRSCLRAVVAGTSGGIALFGNSPVALIELNRLVLEERVEPSLVVAMPVRFAHVLESKEELMSLDVPRIVTAGRRGGSPLAVSALHALCSIATEKSGV
jgi:precorrin-8X/cobalt-precorrin-8 methylmutase